MQMINLKNTDSSVSSACFSNRGYHQPCLVSIVPGVEVSENKVDLSVPMFVKCDGACTVVRSERLKFSISYL